MVLESPESGAWVFKWRDFASMLESVPLSYPLDRTCWACRGELVNYSDQQEPESMMHLIFYEKQLVLRSFVEYCGEHIQRYK